MYCEYCGNQIAPNSGFCPCCGAKLNGNPQGAGAQMNYNGTRPQLNTWLIPAILVTVLCCMPFGLVSVIFATKANNALNTGNYQQAQIDSERAKIWFFVALVLGFISTVLYVLATIAAEM